MGAMSSKGLTLEPLGTRGCVIIFTVLEVTSGKVAFPHNLWLRDEKGRLHGCLTVRAGAHDSLVAARACVSHTNSPPCVECAGSAYAHVPSLCVSCACPSRASHPR